MSHYRKIEVDGKTYEYVVGKTTTKVKDVGLFKNSDYGVPFVFSMNFDSGVAPDPKDIEIVTVSAAGVKRMIRGLPGKPYRHVCERHNFVATSQTYCRFDSEIHEKRTLVNNCGECVSDRADDI